MHNKDLWSVLLFLEAAGASGRCVVPEEEAEVTRQKSVKLIGSTIRRDPAPAEGATTLCLGVVLIGAQPAEEKFIGTLHNDGGGESLSYFK